MKKLLVGIFMVAFAVTFTACSNLTTDEAVIEMNDEEQVFTVEAMSAASLLDFSFVDTLSYTPLSDTTEPVDTEEGEEVIEEEIDEVDTYIELMETFLGNNNGLEVNVLESDREAYENLISYTSVDMFGNSVVYYLYYNETIYEEEDVEDETEVTTEVTTEEPEVTTEEPVTTEPETTEEETSLELATQTRDFQFQDADDDNVVYLLTGVIVQDEVEYAVEGKKIIEEDGSEMLRLRSYIDAENCVKVTYKTDAEDGNKKFFYEVKQDGVIISKSRVHVVQEDGALRVHLTFEDESMKAKYEFAIIEVDDITVIHVKYDIKPTDGVRETGNIHIEVSEDPETGELVYTYKLLESNQQAGGNSYRKEIEKRHEKGSSNRNDNSNNGNKTL